MIGIRPHRVFAHGSASLSRGAARNAARGRATLRDDQTNFVCPGRGTGVVSTAPSA